MVEFADVSLAEGLASTRSIRRYLDEPVTEEQLAALMHLASRAPSGSNRQPFRFVVLRDGDAALEVRRLLAEGAAEVWAQKMDRGDFVATDPNSKAARMIASMEHYVANIATVPLIVLPCMIRYREALASEGASVYPAVQNLLLGARALGLGGALTMFHQHRLDAIRQTLDLPDNVFIAATITIGRPAGQHGPVRRKPLADLVFEDRWDHSPAWAVDPPGTRFTGGPRTHPDDGPNAGASDS